MPRDLHLALDDAADALLDRDDFALLVGMLLDQQIPMERAFAGPAVLADRLGTPESLDPAAIAAMPTDELESLAARTPAIHRFPASMARRIQALAVLINDRYGSEAGRVWRDAGDGASAIRNLRALPGFGDVKARIFLGLVGKQLGEGVPGWREACQPFGQDGTHMSVADVRSRESLESVRRWKKESKRAGR